MAEPKITRRSTLCGPNSRCDHAGTAAAALDSAPNQARSTTRRERRARARTAEFFALALAPAPGPTTLKALDHSPDTKTGTSQLQTAAASTQQQQPAMRSTKLERTSAPPISSCNAAHRASGWQHERNEGPELRSRPLHTKAAIARPATNFAAAAPQQLRSAPRRRNAQLRNGRSFLHATFSRDRSVPRPGPG